MKSLKVWNNPLVNEYYVTVYASGNFDQTFAVEGYTFNSADAAIAMAQTIDVDIIWIAI